jgi:hypothetical protein
VGASRPVSDRIELPGLNVILKLPVPSPGIELGEPASEVAQFIAAEALNFVLNLFDFGHGYEGNGNTPRRACQAGPRPKKT